MSVDKFWALSALGLVVMVLAILLSGCAVGTRYDRGLAAGVGEHMRK